MLDIAHLLIEWGLEQEAARFIDEALRHNELPMLLYLQAWLLLKSTRMAVEAAALIQRASALPPTTLLPWRPLEVQAVEELAEQFPDDTSLKDLNKIVQNWRSANA